MFVELDNEYTEELKRLLSGPGPVVVPEGTRNWLNNVISNRKNSIEGYAEGVIKKITRESLSIVLSKICRYNGWMDGDKFYSVAEHSYILFSMFMKMGMPIHAIIALLHDSTEAIFGDLISPLKRHVVLANGMTVSEYENDLLPEIFKAVLGDATTHMIMTHPIYEAAKHEVHEADIRIRENEMLALRRDRKPVEGSDPIPGIQIHCFEHVEAAHYYSLALNTWSTQYGVIT